MPVKCVECVHLSRKDTPRAMRNLRLLVCKRAPLWEFYAPEFPRECAKFKPEKPAIVQARREWIARPVDPASREDSDE